MGANEVECTNADKVTEEPPVIEEPESGSGEENECENDECIPTSCDNNECEEPEFIPEEPDTNCVNYDCSPPETEKPKTPLPKQCLCPDETCIEDNCPPPCENNECENECPEDADECEGDDCECECDDCDCDSCDDDSTEPKSEDDCEELPEPVCSWAGWCAWSECTKACGGRKIRSRSCVCPDGHIGEADCIGEMFDFDEESCPVCDDTEDVIMAAEAPTDNYY